ncbi:MULTISPECIES: hypothetical protein [Streptomyces]|uniref:hypothetical protein n=1 Tax=Streptomyces TaxID=1883 RepID=UPI0004C50832|nr:MULTISPECIES: hypothetical protein [Streptomyces]MDX2918874.1 hypothetical protein [Streptomyces sp. NE06-03C]MDX3607636.1 hypothetical protein [Streptomyces sp. FL06-04B]MDX3736766.1 hypothetical protein [Streptomyces sp. ID01-15D]
MTEETILLRDFLATMNRLQAEFERRLDGIEREAPPGAPPHGVSGATADPWQPWSSHDLGRPLGLEAIWADTRSSPVGRADAPGTRPLAEKALFTAYPD